MKLKNPFLLAIGFCFLAFFFSVELRAQDSDHEAIFYNGTSNATTNNNSYPNKASGFTSYNYYGYLGLSIIDHSNEIKRIIVTGGDAEFINATPHGIPIAIINLRELKIYLGHKLTIINNYHNNTDYGVIIEQGDPGPIRNDNGDPFILRKNESIDLVSVGDGKWIRSAVTKWK